MNRGEILVAAREYAEENFQGKVFIPGSSYISPSGAVIKPENVVDLVEVALKGWYTEHRNCTAFSKALASRAKAAYCTLVNSGSSADLIAITACLESINRKKFVITTAVGFPTTVSPIIQNGQLPIFIDIDPYSLTPDMDQLEYMVSKHGDQISGAIFAHTLGFPFDEGLVRELLPSDAWLIVDACDALGLEMEVDEEWLPAGWAADATTYSFFPAHQITSGEGGAITTSDYELHRVISSLVNWGRDCFCLPGQNNTCGCRFSHNVGEFLPEGWDHKYVFTHFGYNLKMTEFQGALGAGQMGYLDEFINCRVENYNSLYQKLCGFDDLALIPLPDGVVPFGFPISIPLDSRVDVRDLIGYLEDSLIGTRRVFGGNLLRQPAFQHLSGIRAADLDGSNYVMDRMFWVGCWPGIGEDHLRYMAMKFEDYLDECA